MNTPHKPSFVARHWFVGLIVASLLVHVVALTVFQPWVRTSMTFDRQEQEAQAALVRERELERQAYEKARRQEIRLPSEHAEQISKREEAKRKSTLQENVIRLVNAREKVMKEREEAFEKLKERTEKDVLPDELKRMEGRLRRMEHSAHQVTREPKLKDEADKLESEVRGVRKDTEAMRKQAEKTPDDPPDYRKKADEIAKNADEWAKKYQEMADASDGSAQRRAMQAKRAAESLKKEAAKLANKGIDIEAMNDTSAEDEVGDVPPAAQPGQVAEASSADLYDAAVELERQVNIADEQARAAELALLHGSSMADARKKVASPPTDRPDLSPTLRMADEAGGIQTVGDLNAYRDAIALATSETSDMARRADRRADDEGAPTQARNQATGSHDDARNRRMAWLSRGGGQGNGRVVDLTALQLANWQGGGEGGATMSGLRADLSGRGGEMIGGKGRESKIRLTESTVVANALPGRMLTERSAREGFLYVDTWYIIGPWDNWSRAHFEITHPPEQRIDLDAKYYDGKFANRPKHPDHILRWEFVQSDRIAIQPPRVIHSATFYAYTEVYSDKTREMLVAVASDDMAKVWLNGDVIWTDVGQSGWRLDEGFRKVIFRKGFNTMLVRIENGPAYCVFSVLLCPPELMQES